MIQVKTIRFKFLFFFVFLMFVPTMVQARETRQSAEESIAQAAQARANALSVVQSLPDDSNAWNIFRKADKNLRDARLFLSRNDYNRAHAWANRAKSDFNLVISRYGQETGDSPDGGNDPGDPIAEDGSVPDQNGARDGEQNNQKIGSAEGELKIAEKLFKEATELYLKKKGSSTNRKYGHHYLNSRGRIIAARKYFKEGNLEMAAKKARESRNYSKKYIRMATIGVK